MIRHLALWLMFGLLVLGCGEREPSFVDRVRKLPGVHAAEVFVAARKPDRRIVQINDWQLPTRDAFAARLRGEDQSFPDNEIDMRYDKILDEVQSVQTEQMGILRAMIREFGVKRVFHEGLSEAELPAWRKKIDDLRKVDMARIENRLERANRAMRDAQIQSQDVAEARELQTNAADERRRFRIELLGIGAPGQLLMAGDLADVLPVEEAGLTETPLPPRGSGKESDESRKAAMARVLLAGESPAIVVLSGKINLREEMERLGNGTTEYIVVTGRRYQGVAGQ